MITERNVVKDPSRRFVRAEKKPHFYYRDGEWALFNPSGCPGGTYKTVREAQAGFVRARLA
jgi:hypothetical protein